MEEYVGGEIFKRIEIDKRVTPDLAYCIFCEVIDRKKDAIIKDAQISLDSLGDGFKQCPMCKRIYILHDPLVRTK